MKKVKQPNVAGTFYPDNPDELKNLLQMYLKEANPTVSLTNPQAIIAPHAGLIYSGSIAASAYKYLEQMEVKPDKIAVLSPGHYYDFAKIAVSDATHFKTPLGEIPLDRELIEYLLQKDQVENIPQVFEREHALEVHLPFLQMILPQCRLIPLVVGRVSPTEVEEVIEMLNSHRVFIVVSSDLSHFHDYEAARKIDFDTSKIIENKEYEKLRSSYACGYYSLKGLLKWSLTKGLAIKTLDVRNSGDTAGDKSKVVGYGAFSVDQSTI